VAFLLHGPIVAGIGDLGECGGNSKAWENGCFEAG